MIVSGRESAAKPNCVLDRRKALAASAFDAVRWASPTWVSPLIFYPCNSTFPASMLTKAFFLQECGVLSYPRTKPNREIRIERISQ